MAAEVGGVKADAGGYGLHDQSNTAVDEAPAEGRTAIKANDDYLAGKVADYMKVMEDAPWAPVFNEQRFTMRSNRIGGQDSLFVDPVRIPINYDYIFIKGE